MKKLLLFLFMVGMVMFTSCNSCKKNSDVQPVNDTTLVAAINVENTISLDRQTMYAQYSEDYRWFETCIVLKNYLDEENTSSEIEAVSNVFQYLTNVTETGADVSVVFFSHTSDTTAVEVRPDAFWVGDRPLNEAEVPLTFEDAYQRLMESNVVKPHSRQCVLRREVGVVEANAQYIFGNTEVQAYVDAVTGAVSADNPAFEGVKLATPLGEWP